MTNNEILYKVNERSMVCIFGEIFLIIAFILISCIAFSSDKILFTSFGVFLALFALYIFIVLITFNELVIYKDRVEINRKFFGISIIKIDEIKYVLVHGSLFSEWLSFQLKSSRFSYLKYLVTSLHIKDECEIRNIIKNLQGDKQ
ncbi:MAG: hypothetical protein LBJ88_02690 [Campylobacteraceae bacterium]|jgi:hypothetical protein|nr:hypothetical protein [Campylobacteraceae bacterium]